MKTALGFVSVFVFVFMILATPQNSFARDWLIGPDIGINFGFTSYESPEISTYEGTARIGILAGINIEKNISRSFSLQSGLRYSQNGVKTDLLNILPGTVKLDYVQIPIKLKYRIQLLGFKPFLFLGTTPGFAVKRSVELLSLLELDRSTRFSSFDISLDVGGGVEWEMVKNIFLVLGLQANFGIKDLSHEADTYYSRAFIITAGVATIL